MTLIDQLKWGAIHSISESRGGSDKDQARAAVQGYLRLKHLHVTLALSAINTGLDQIQRGRVEEGERVARHGLDYLRGKIEGAQS